MRELSECRHSRPVGLRRLLGLVALGLVCGAVVAGPAQAVSRKARNWPNSPLRHTLRQKAGETIPSFASNLRGNVAVAGNTLETCPQNLVASRKRHATRHRRSTRAAEPCLNNNNNDENMVYVNVDPGEGRFDSSTATLNVPAGAHIVRAFLYWAADLSSGVRRPPNGPADAAPGGSSPTTNPLYTTANLRVGAGAYARVDATAAGRDGRWDYIQSWYNQPGESPGWAYQVRADVTPELNAGLAANGRRGRSGQESIPITVANVQAGVGYNRYAGWNLIVVWSSPTAAWRNVTLFDGFDFVQVQGGQQLVVGPLDFQGFQTPGSGNVDAQATVWATEGDRAITGDYLSLGGLSTSCTGLKPQSDALHPANNFFNSTISNAGSPVGGRTPGYDNQLGFDLATLSVPEGTIPNGATGASVCLGTVGDTYFFGGVAFSTLIRAPNLKITKVASRQNAGPGDVVGYASTVTNPSQRDPSDPLFGTPVDAATNLLTADPLPSGLDFVGFTVNPGGVCGYTAATRTISCNVGTLAPDVTFSYAYQARVQAVAQGSTSAALVNSACFAANSEDQPDVVYNGCDQATVVVPPAPPAPADLGVVKTVSDTNVAPGGQVTWHIVATNYGPATSAGFVLADQLPAGVAFVSATASAPLACTTPAVGAGGSITCTAASVPPRPADGSSLTLTIVTSVSTTTADGTLLTNIATVAGNQTEPTPDPHSNRDSASTLVVTPGKPVPPPSPPPPPNPDGPPQPPVPPVHPPLIPGGPAGTRLALHKTAPRSASPGDRIAYTLRVSNIANAAALHVRVCDEPPLGLAIISAPGFHRAGRAVCTTISRLVQGAVRSLRLTASVRSGVVGLLTNRATVTSSNAPSVRARGTTHVVPRRPPAGRG